MVLAEIGDQFEADLKCMLYFKIEGKRRKTFVLKQLFYMPDRYF